jgi:hypothetical protein
MSTNKDSNPGQLEDDVQTALKGAQALLQQTQSYVMGGLSYTGLQVVQTLTAWLALFTAYTAAKSAAKTALSQRRASEPSMRAFLKVLHDFATAQYGATSENLRLFGFEPEKAKKPLSAGKQVIKAVKAQQTREERGTLGSSQKKSVHAVTPPAVTIDGNGEVQPVTPPGAAKAGS